ncbi:MAG: US12 family protein [Planctomycetes bacterium]|nr:US12 family protein [Planctomycetota bacterium]
MHSESQYYTGEFAEYAAEDERTSFITRVYIHLAAAVAAFILIEATLFQTGAAISITEALLSGSWLIVLGAFMIVGMIADRMARSDTSPAVAYSGLALYVVAESIIICPLLMIASMRHEGIILQAGLVTAGLFAALTTAVLVTRKDFSFLRTALYFGGIGALVLIVVAAFTSLTLGFWFSVGMAVLMCGYILYYTSNILHHYRTDQHVSATLALFASLATLFWYILRIFMSRD